MNGRIAKKIRREVYGDFTSNSEGRRYKQKRNNYLGNITGSVISDHRRQAYQKAKKLYKGGKVTLTT